ncbi:hypothetical protein PROFUN_06140 [Planoprotostelium fungivorum]|uniref:Uncharacterized protein n=1 Tax=Planoprotostelium fungivorum TaxID=1890364 RepID=A0A2P6NPI6_9EUKA|nr:hypothetical protein PROFUN_06140 [Planoprotostelium fungivorum]
MATIALLFLLSSVAALELSIPTHYSADFKLAVSLSNGKNMKGSGDIYSTDGVFRSIYKLPLPEGDTKISTWYFYSNNTQYEVDGNEEKCRKNTEMHFTGFTKMSGAQLTETPCKKEFKKGKAGITWTKNDFVVGNITLCTDEKGVKPYWLNSVEDGGFIRAEYLYIFDDWKNETPKPEKFVLPAFC